MSDMFRCGKLIDLTDEELADNPTTFIANDDGSRIERRARKAVHPAFDRPIAELEAPNPPKYFGGACQYKPMPGIESAIARALARPDWNLVALCRTCQTLLQEPYVQDTERNVRQRLNVAFVIGAASDHDRINMNHDVLVVALPERVVIWHSDWHPLRTSAGVRRR